MSESSGMFCMCTAVMGQPLASQYILVHIRGTPPISYPHTYHVVTNHSSYLSVLSKMAPTTSVKCCLYPGEFVWRLDDAGSFKRPWRNPPLPQSEVQAQYRAHLNDKLTQEEELAEKDMSILLLKGSIQRI